MLLALLLAGWVSVASAQPVPQAGDPTVLSELAFIERLYREGDSYRAEGELLRFLAMHPRHPERPAAELARAKLYYREGRYGEANLRLYSLLDRHPRSEAAADAQRLLTFSHLRQRNGARAAETAAVLVAAGAVPDIATLTAELRALSAPHPDEVDVDAAETWSTWLPGSGYFALGQPGKAVTGVTLNLALLGAAVLAVQNDNAPGALLLLAIEGLLWQGGRSGVRQEGEAFNRRLRERRLDDWLARRGEPELLGVGLALRFGGG